MKTFQFNTNIANSDSLPQLSSVLNKDRRIISFKVNSQDSNHQLEVSCSEDISEREVRQLISMAGFEAYDSNNGNTGSAS
jgi:hypothetical protein